MKEISTRYVLPPWCDPTKVPAVVPAMGKVMKGIEGIAKSKTNSGQGYKFRGIDQVYDMIHGLLSEHELITLPVVLDRVATETKTKKGDPQLHVTECVEYWFTSTIDGSQMIIGPVFSEALDSSDKATNKCMSFAQKYAVLQCFTVPTSDVAEGDHDDEQRGTAKGGESKGKTREPGEDDATDVISTDTAKQVYRQFGELGISKEMLDAKIGYGVDGLEVGWLEQLRKWRDECKNKANIERIFGSAKTENKT